MPRLLLLTPTELTRDPRARRAAIAARGAGYEVVGVCGSHPGEAPVPLGGIELVRVARDHVSGRLRSAGLGGPARPTPIMREARGLFRVVRLAVLTARLARAARSLPPADVVHANDLDSLPTAWLVCRRTRARLVYDAHELYADQEPDPPRVYRGFMRRLERRLTRHADAVLTVSGPIAEELRRSLRLPALPTVVLSCPPRVEVEPAQRGAGPLRAVYQGAMGPGRRLADLLDAVERADGTQLTIRVVNANLEELRRAVAARGLEGRVDVADPVSPDELVEALAAFHVGLVINRPVTRNDELVLPNKLFEYLMAGLAVVVPRLPGPAPLVEREGVGVTYEPGNALELAAALTRLAAEPELLAELRRRARQVALERFNAEEQAPILAAAWKGPP